MTRLSVAVAAVLLVGGCGLRPDAPLLTWDRNGCFTAHVVGPLVFDAEYGTRVTAGTMADGSASRPIVVWPPGFRAVRSGPGVVDVLSPSGDVVATTGQTYSLEGGYVTGEELHIPGFDRVASVYWVCGEVVPQ